MAEVIIRNGEEVMIIWVMANRRFLAYALFQDNIKLQKFTSKGANVDCAAAFCYKPECYKTLFRKLQIKLVIRVSWTFYFDWELMHIKTKNIEFNS